MRRLRYKYVLLVVITSDKPILDTLICELEYLDGTKAQLSENVIAENMFAQVYGEWNKHVLFE